MEYVIHGYWKQTREFNSAFTKCDRWSVLSTDEASGSSVDWAFDKAGIPHAYAPELRDKGQYGFIAPASEIDPSAKEVYEAIKVIGNHIIE